MARKKQNLLGGAMTLTIAALIVHCFGLVFKIYVTEKLGPVARGYYAAAYNLYTPIYYIAVSGLPVAISTLVAKYAAMERFRDVVKIHKISVRMFFWVGLVGTLVMIGAAYPYTHFVTHSPNAFPATLMLAPAILLCCLISAYRGYFAGLKNMWPHGISQIVEAVFKLLFGFILVRAVLAYTAYSFENTGAVFGKACATYDEAVVASWPYAAAAAILGVSIASLMALIYMMLRYRIGGNGITESELEASPEPLGSRAVVKNITHIAVPVVISGLINNIALLIDVSTIQNRLFYAVSGNLEYFRTVFATELNVAGVADSEINSFLYGVFDYTQDIENLIPNITVTLGLTALPILSEAWTLRNKLNIQNSVNSVLRICVLISLPAGLGIAAIPDELLHLLYGDTAGISIAAPILAIYGVSMVFIAISQPLTFMLQAVGRLKIPIYATFAGTAAKIVCNFVFVSIPEYNIKGAAVGTAVCYMLITIVSLYSLIETTHAKIEWKSVLIKPLICSVIAIAACYGSNMLLRRVLPVGDLTSRINGQTISALISVAITVFVYAVALLLTRSLTSTDVKMLPKGEKIEKVLAKLNLLG